MTWRTVEWWRRIVALAFAGACFAILAGVMALVYLAMFDPVNPMVHQRLIRIDIGGPPGSPYLDTTREFCFSRASEAEASRLFRRVPDTPTEREVVIETIPTRIHFDQGCFSRARRIDLPDQFTAGRWQLQTALRWCNNIGRCQSVWLPVIAVRVSGVPGNFSLTVETAD